MGGIRSRKYCIQRDDPQYRGGCRPFRAAAPLCGSSFAAGAGRTGERTADWNCLQRGHPGPQLAASDPHASAGAEASRRAHRVGDYRYENHAGQGPCAHQTHRGRRFPPGDVPRSAAGTEKSRIRSAGAGLCVPPGNSVRIDGACAERYPADVRQLRTAGNGR